MADIIREQSDERSLPQQWKDLGNGAYALTVSVVGGGGGGGADRELIVETYQANKAFTGASLGDLITATRMIDVSGSSPAQVGTTSWFNETTQLALAGAPLRADIDLAGGGGGATNAQIVAALGTQTAALNGTLATEATLATVAKQSTLAAVSDRLGATNSSVAATTAEDTGLSGLVRGLWKFFVDRASAAGLFVHGNVANAAADTGNPVKVGGKYLDTAPTLTDGQRGDVMLSANGAVSVNISNSVAAAADAVANADAAYYAARNPANNPKIMTNANYMFNGATWDRMRGSAAGGLIINGNVAATVADTGSPVKVGGVYTTGAASLVSGTRGNMAISKRSAVITTVDVENVLTDAAPNAYFQQTRNGADMLFGQVNYTFNGTTYDRERGNTNGTFMQGSVADGTTEAGNAVKVGGQYSGASPTAVTAGQRVSLQMTSVGSAMITPQVAAAGVGDAYSNVNIAYWGTRSGSGGYVMTNANYVFNGTTWDRQRGDANGIFVQGAAAFPVFTKPVTAITATALFTALAAVAPGANTTGVALRKTFTASGLTTAGAGTAQVIFEGAQDNSASIWEEFGRADLVLGTTAIAESFSSEDRFRVVRARLAAITGTGATASASMTY